MGSNQSKDKIIIMGGYGQVGGCLSKALAQQYPERVFAVGRSLEKAKAFEKQTQGLVKGRACDLSKENQVDALLDDAQLVIMCFVPKDTRLVEKCIEKGVHYIDISPSYKNLKPLEKYSKQAEAHNSSIILGVGICPGLTNLMIGAIKEQYKKIETVESTMLLGVGETYGMDALDWLVNNLYSKIQLERQSGHKEVIPFRKGKKIDFLSRKPQVAYPLDLADQHIVPKTLGVDAIRSRFCYDVNWITRETALMARLKLISKGLLVKAIWVAQKLKIGSDDYVLNIQAIVQDEGVRKKVIYEISGSDNAKMTAYVAAAIAHLVLEGRLNTGVHYLEELTSLEEILTGHQLEKALQRIKESMALCYQFNSQII